MSEIEELLSLIGGNTDKLPIYLKTMDIKPKSKYAPIEYCNLTEGTFLLPDVYYKPISKHAIELEAFKTVTADD